MLKKFLFILLIVSGSFNNASETSKDTSSECMIDYESIPDNKMDELYKLISIIYLGATKINKSDKYAKLCDDANLKANKEGNFDSLIDDLKKYVNEIASEINPNNPEDALKDLKDLNNPENEYLIKVLNEGILEFDSLK